MSLKLWDTAKEGSPVATLAAPRSLGVRALQGVLNDIMDAKARADAR